ncbi:MAG TPA: DUF2214 family protein [Cellvibrionaceae bacterium]
MADTLVSYLHYLGFMTLFAAVVAQHLFFAPEASAATVMRLVRLDGIVGISALLVLITGLLKVFVVGLPAAVYAKNPFLHTKFTLFVLAALISVRVTLDLFKARKVALAAAPGALISLPRRIAIIQRIELLALVTLPLLAAFMVRY